MQRTAKLTTIAVFVFIMSAATAHAQATRTWVSGVGDDANPCSRTAPCKTFAGAISKTAAGGEINVLDPGGFGAVTITKSITIDGSPGNLAGVLVSGTNGIVVNAGPSDVVILRNLDIDGLATSLSGVLFLGGKALFVENSQIYAFQYGIRFAPTVGPASLSVDKTFVRNNTSGGLFVNPGAGVSVTASVAESRFERNQFGVRATDGSVVTIKDSVASGNTGNGFAAAPSTGTAEINFDRCIASNNGAKGVVANGAGATTRISNTMITNNVTGIYATAGGKVVSFGNNSIAGNGTDGVPTTTIPLQ